MRLFLDSSALAKRCLADAESAHVARQCAQADEVLFSILAPLEVLDAARELRRDGALTKAQVEAVKERLAAHAERATVIGIAPPAVERAARCVEWGLLPPLEALQVGCALAAKPDLFLSADQRQCHVARSLGLEVGHLHTPPPVAREPKWPYSHDA